MAGPGTGAGRAVLLITGIQAAGKSTEAAVPAAEINCGQAGSTAGKGARK